ncbi:MAG: sigma-70 family RNA polymerase sigma factor [Planctomycetes bacterium]|nr:sigma-70 family RNA polymerase sigma factor [Planctomycetota bacterium]
MANTPASAGFPTTRWSTVLDALAPERASHEALEHLCRRYWFPLYAFARRRGLAHDEAEDVVQAFLARFLEKRDWRVDPARGRFRAYLAASMRHFLANEAERARAEKRGAGRALVSIDADTESRFALEVADGETPERAYERSFALALLDEALARLAAEQAKAGKAAQFARLQPFLGPDTEAPAFAELALDLGTNEGALRVALHRLRRRYGELVRLAVLDLVTDPADVDAELRALSDALAT